MAFKAPRVGPDRAPDRIALPWKTAKTASGEEPTLAMSTGVYTNYEPTPTPMPPGRRFKSYQHDVNSSVAELGFTGQIPPWSDYFGRDKLSRWDLLGTFYMANKEQEEVIPEVNHNWANTRCKTILNYNGATETVSSYGTASSTGSSTASTNSQILEDHGVGRRVLQTGTGLSRRNLGGFSINYYRNAGFLATWKIRIPTTANQVNLSERFMHLHLYNGTVVSNVNDPAGEFAGFKYRNTPPSGFTFRTGNGTNTEVTGVGEIAMDTVYNLEMYVPKGGAAFYARVNGSLVATHSTYIPNYSTALDTLSYCFGQETDQGDSVFDCWYHQLWSF